MIYVYAITDQSTATLPPISGLEEAPLRDIVCRRISGVVSDFPHREIAPTRDSLWKHEEIVETLMAVRTILPVRFGALLAEETALQQALLAHYDELVADLDRVRGCVELGLRVLWQDEEALSIAERKQELTASDGRSYMFARLQQERESQAQYRRAEELALRIHIPLDALAKESSHALLVTPRLLLNAVYLVKEEAIAPFQQEVKSLQVAHPALSLLCTGPWPPYSFVQTGAYTLRHKEGYHVQF